MRAVFFALACAAHAARLRTHRFYGAPPFGRAAAATARPVPTLPNVTLGPIEDVLPWATQHCNCSAAQGCTDPNDPDVADTPPRVFVDSRGVAHLWASDAEPRQSLRAAADPAAPFLKNCTVHVASAFDCRPAAYNFQTWVHSPFALAGGANVLAAVHMEYHGWQCQGNSSCANSAGGDCANEAVLLYQSRDGGSSYAPASGARGSLPGNVLAMAPWTYEHARDNWNHSEMGFGDPSPIVYDPASDSYNIMVSAANPPIGDNGYTGLQQRGQCLLRAPAAAAWPPNGSLWRAWDGEGFNADLSADPYTAVIANASAHVCAPINTSMIHVNLGWSTHFGKWISSGFGSYAFQNGTEIPCCGAFLYSVSDDLINWDTPQLLRACKEEGKNEDWEYDAAFLDETAWSQHGQANWHALIGGDTAHLYFWQADPGTRGRSVKRQRVAFGPAAASAPATSVAAAAATAAAPRISLNATTIPHLGWVRATVTLAAPATAGLFLTVHTPAAANVTPIPPQPYPAEAPWLAAAAQKWVACASIVGCLGSTSFSFDFSLVNSFADAIVHAFEGGVAAPRHLAASAPITFSDPTAPSRGHLARLSDPTRMNVTWWATSAAGGGVKWGASPSALGAFAPAALATSYAPSDLCGEPARGMGWQPSHVWLTATITGLSPGAAAPVFYSYGSDALGWSAPLSFRAPPAPGAPVRVLLLADVGVTEPDGAQDHWDEPDASLTVARLRALAQGGSGYDWSLTLHPGDVSYATGLLAKWPTHTARLAGLWDRVPYWVSQGNHERDAPGTGTAFDGSTDSGGECGVVTSAIFPGSGGPTALVHGAVALLMLNSELAVDAGSPQFAFAQAWLAAVDRARTPWSVVAFHRPLYWVDAPGGARDAHFAPLEPLLVRFGVDAVIVGHVHNALVTCPVVNGTCAPAGRAPVHVCVGNGGQGLTPIPNATRTPPWVVFQRSAWGFGTLEANATAMDISLFADDTGELWHTAHFDKA